MQQRWRVQALGVSIGSPLCLSLPPHLNRWSCYLDRWIVVDMHMSVLLVCDDYSGACFGIDQGSTACYGVVHLSDSLLSEQSFRFVF